MTLKMLARVLRRHARRGAACTVNAVSRFPRPTPVQSIQSRSFLTSRTLTSYVMKRAKIVQIVWRTLAAYPEMHYISEPDAPIHKLFSRDSSLRERAFMYVLGLLPPDEAVDLPAFLQGAEDAAKCVLASVYGNEANKSELLESLATPECVSLWKKKREQVCRLLQVDDEASLWLHNVNVKRVGVSEINYWFRDAKIGEDEPKKDDLEPPSAAAAAIKTKLVESHAVKESRPHSKFLTHETMQLKVQFKVQEHFTVEEAANSRSVVVDSTFEWAFESDVSRAELLDWVVTSASPFSSKVAEKDDSEEDIADAIESAA